MKCITVLSLDRRLGYTLTKSVALVMSVISVIVLPTSIHLARETVTLDLGVVSPHTISYN